MMEFTGEFNLGQPRGLKIIARPPACRHLQPHREAAAGLCADLPARQSGAWSIQQKGTFRCVNHLASA
jgi:hypothetical protein